MKTPLLLAIAASVAISLSACGGGNSDSQATATPSVPPATATPAPDPQGALSILLVSANVVGTPEPDGTKPVRVVYRVTVNAPRGISSAYGSVDLGATSCDGGSIGLSMGPTPSGATLQQSSVVLCSADDADSLEREPHNFESLGWRPSTVSFQ